MDSHIQREETEKPQNLNSGTICRVMLNSSNQVNHFAFECATGCAQIVAPESRSTPTTKAIVEDGVTGGG